MNYSGQLDDINNLEIYMQAVRLGNISFPANTPGYEYPLTYIGLGLYDVDEFYLDESEYVEISITYRAVLSYHRVTDNGAIFWTESLYTPVAYPLGNQSCIDQLLVIKYGQDHVTLLQSENYWGYEVSLNVFRNVTDWIPNWNVTMQLHFDYSKDDGFLAHYHGITTYVDSGVVFQNASLERVGLDWEPMTPYNVTIPISQTQTMNTDPLIIGMYTAAGVAWVVVITFMIFDYRKRVSSHERIS
ncbi:MAG: hypothetical protein ACTSW8_10515 [Candidatus Thorarchaeota archaeon]